jgi:hypothetical protein
MIRKRCPDASLSVTWESFMQVRSWMLSSVLAPIAAAGFVVAGAGVGHADTYNITGSACTNGCGAGGGGSITVTNDGTFLAVDVELTGTEFLHQGGLSTIGFDVSGAALTSADITNLLYEGTKTGFTFSSNTMMDGSGKWDYVINLSPSSNCTGVSNTCGQSLKFDITTTGAVTFQTDNNGHTEYFAVNVADIPVSGAVNTGVVEATLAATPLPPAVALLAPVLGFGLLRLRRRRALASAAA